MNSAGLSNRRLISGYLVVSIALLTECRKKSTADLRASSLSSQLYIAAIGEMNFEVTRFDRRQEVQKLQSLFLAEPGQELFKDFNELVRGKAPQLFFFFFNATATTGNSA